MVAMLHNNVSVAMYVLLLSKIGQTTLIFGITRYRFPLVHNSAPTTARDATAQALGDSKSHASFSFSV